MPEAGPPLVLVTLDPNSTATPTPFQPPEVTYTPLPTETLAATETPAPTETSTPVPSTATPEDTATPAPTEPLPTAVPASTRTLYTMYVTLDYDNDSLAANETVRYTNTTGQSLSDVVMAVEPNLWTNCFTLSTLQQDGSDVSNYSLNGERLTIVPSQPIAAGAVTTFSLGFNLALPAKSYSSTFGYLSNQINLTDWYPFIVPYSDGWVLHGPPAFGEHLVYDAADYDVHVTVKGTNVVLAASAPGVTNGSSTDYHLEGARTFVLSASDSFQVDESAVGSVKIRSYYLNGHGNASKGVVWMATQALGLYEAKFGPYAYPSLSIVETELADGQEYDGLVFLASKFYDEYSGTAKSDLFTIGTHEIAHQWWFGLVGSDQATQPWLDEAMAVYSERIFYEYNYPAYGDWWWNFRVNYFDPSGYVDSSVYDFSTFRAYVNAVYLNGANFLDDLRTRIGDQAFFSFLADYASTYAHGHASAQGFFALLRRHTNREFSDIVGRYFQESY